jgi:hypothetical protein
MSQDIQRHLWLLSRRDGGARIYDHYVEFLVRASTEEQARQLAHDRIVEEDRKYEIAVASVGHPVDEAMLAFMRAAQGVWLDPEITVAKIVTDTGPSVVIAANFKPG